MIGKSNGHRVSGISVSQSHYACAKIYLREGSGAVGLHARQGLGPLRESQRALSLGRAATANEEALLHQTAHHTEGIVDRAIGLVQHHAVTATHEDGDRGAHVHNVGELHHLGGGARDGDLLGEATRAHLLGGEMVNVRDGLHVQGATDEVHVVALNVRHHHDI